MFHYDKASGVDTDNLPLLGTGYVGLNMNLLSLV